MPDDTRIIWSEQNQRFEDEYLETVFYELYHDQISDPAAIAQLLDPYAKAALGKDIILFDGSLTDTDHAMDWSIQFGDICIVSEEGKVTVTVHSNIGAHVIACSDKITRRRAIVLAGVEYLRQVAYRVLNNSDKTAKPN